MPSEEDYGAKLREMKKAARVAEAANRLCAQKAKQAADYAKRYRERRESVQHAVEADRAEIARLTRQIDELEQKMRHHEQTVYVLTEYIETKGAESHFEGIAEECLGMLQNVNTESITQLKERPVHSLY